MRELPPLGPRGILAAACVLLLAAGTRVGYLATCCDWGAGALRLTVQDRGLDRTWHEREPGWSASPPPLAPAEEASAYEAPGYAWLASWFRRDADLRRFQAGLSILTVLLLFLYARHAFASNLPALFVGLLAVLEPFWIINLGEIADGTVATFLLAAALWLASRAARRGGPLTSLTFGLTLAALALVRASQLPLTFVFLGWFLLRCRDLRLGWFAGLLAILGFGNGLAPWTVHNFRLYGEPVPVVTSAYLHLWMGSMPGANGGPVIEPAIRASLPPERLRELLNEPNQARRYNRLSHDLLRQIREDPGGTLDLRLAAALTFVVGGDLRRVPLLVSEDNDRRNTVQPPEVVAEWYEAVAAGSLILLLMLAALGWRVTAFRAADCRLVALALVLLPLPFILSHAEGHCGARLPWDAVLVLFAGYAVAWMFPSVRRRTVATVLLRPGDSARGS